MTRTDAAPAQAGLQSYRVGRTPRLSAELSLFAGRTIEVPTAFIPGKSDWGVFQRAGSFEAMQKTACTKFRGAHLLDGAGHWVQQERPALVSDLLVQFLRDAGPEWERSTSTLTNVTAVAKPRTSATGVQRPAMSGRRSPESAR